MKATIWKSTVREIRGSLGRFLAILAIVALGVGFFAGLKVTQPAMLDMAQQYWDEAEFYDYRLVSEVGFTDDEVEELADQDDVRTSAGAYTYDVLCEIDGEDRVIKTHSITEDVNRLVVTSGRLPQTASECVVDAALFDESAIGETLVLSDENDEEELSHFTEKEYTITGIVQSPLYVQFERGSTSLGNGRVSGFMYLLPEGFDAEIYTEVYVKFDSDLTLYSDAYDELIDDKQDAWEELVQTQATERYQSLYGAYAEEGYEPDIYVLGRDQNVGYACFESDSSIVDGVANVFPVFFFLVAALVCVTTMNRMVEEQRTQIGVFKALGYSERTIMGKYIFYSGTAAVIGCAAGFAAGTFFLPKVIWYAYGMLYRMQPLSYLFDGKMAAVSLFVSLLCSVGTTVLSCQRELGAQAASLMRPKAPKAGKRVFLERLPFVWKRLKFLQKVSVRNILRYKKRFFMMILGISGCTALLVTGFGVRDSVTGIVTQQYTQIQTYDIGVTYSDDVTDEQRDTLAETDGVASAAYAAEMSMDLCAGDKTKSVSLIVSEPDTDLTDFISLHTKAQEPIAFPGKGEAVIAVKLSEELGISVGDSVTLQNENMDTIEVTVSGICENFVYNYVYLSADTYEEQTGAAPEYKSAYVKAADGTDGHELGAALMELSGVASVSILEDDMERFSGMMDSMNLIVFVLILCAAGLAFIVLYNLTNINITERVREIATIEVLGFYEKETAAYVFRENTLLTFLGALVGLVLGIFLHRFVMSKIVVDMVSFDVRILPVSFVYSVVLTMLFTWIVDFLMRKKISGISMTESLKSVD